MANTKKPQTWSNLLQADREPEKEGPSTFDQMAGTMVAAASFTAAWAKDQMHSAGQDFVSRVLLGESYSPQHASEAQQEPQHDKEERDIDR